MEEVRIFYLIYSYNANKKIKCIIFWLMKALQFSIASQALS